ncbi:hypothetical protein GCM10022402_30510 [Salinactinospora qingdaonensis]|uniref:VanZ-like domain-containing protein n=1 Tax=Salinactinospora qingdaonensis TaxID=702744 RepID=A0ABP7FW90_9ACTN
MPGGATACHGLRAGASAKGARTRTAVSPVGGGRGRRHAGRGRRAAAKVWARLGLAARGAALVSVLGLLLTGQWLAALGFALILLALLLIWQRRVPVAVDAVFASVTVVAAWANVESWYQQVPGVDMLIHLLLTGSGGVVGLFALVELGGLPALEDSSGRVRRWAVVLWVVMVGITGAMVWELYEWWMDLVTQEFPARHHDVRTDLVAGTLGALAAGLAVALGPQRWRRRAR